MAELKHILILGRRRQGKSTLALALGLDQGNSVLIFDPNQQYTAFRGLSDVRLAVETLAHKRIVVFRPGVGQVESQFDGLVRELWPPDVPAPVYENLSLLIDESSYLQSPHYLNPELERLMRLAPPDLRLIQTTHRLVDTNRLTRTLSTDFYLFQNKSGKDLELIRQEFEYPELAAAVSALGIYKVVHYTVGVGGQRLFWTWDHSEDWFLPITAAEQANDGRNSGSEREPDLAFA